MSGPKIKFFPKSNRHKVFFMFSPIQCLMDCHTYDKIKVFVVSEFNKRQILIPLLESSSTQVLNKSSKDLTILFVCPYI